MVTLRSRQAVSRAAAIGASKTAVAGRATNRNKAAKATGRQLRTRSAGVVKTRAGPGSVGAKRASAPLIVVESPANTPSKSTSEPLAIAKGSTTPLRVYSPRRQRPSRASSEGKAKASKPAKSSRKSLRGQKKPKSSLAADVDTPTPKRKKKATFADASPSSQGHFPHLEQYMSEMKAYFADVDAYELQEE